MLIQAVGRALEGRADYYDIRLLDVTGTVIETRKGEVTRAISGKDSGACVRVLYDGAWGFATTSDRSEQALCNAAERAAKIAKGISEGIKDKARLAPVTAVTDEAVIQMKRSFLDEPVETKLEYLKSAYDAVKKYDFVTNAMVSYKDTYTIQEFYSSEGAAIKTEVPRILWTIELVGKRDSHIQSVRRRIGRAVGLEAFDGDQHLKEADAAVASVVALLSARAPPAGTMPVIADPGLVGVFAHEAVGHASEGDLVATGNSCFEGMIGKEIGNPGITIKDDATLPGLFGSYIYDDEGVRTRTKVLIKDGVLTDFILNRESAARLNMEPNGGARAESYHSRPIVRMSNTHIETGDATFQEMLEGVKKGVYVKGSRGGQVNTSQGFFQFNAQEAYMIENGEITHPLRDVSLSGRTLDILKLIDLVGKDAEMGHAGICGKGQSVTVDDGGPHIRISQCVVGGQ
ncbi:TldD/PmbA family protein [Methanocella arvoryzae]|nr:TldD/PmbA family protein [Methanocella arvoryzae]